VSAVDIIKVHIAGNFRLNVLLYSIR